MYTREIAHRFIRELNFVEVVTKLLLLIRLYFNFKMLKFLTFALIVSCVTYQSEASAGDVETKFRDEEIVPDVLAVLPELKVLKISYPSGVSVNLGNVLTPTQVKDKPTVEWEAEAGALYTLLMTGEFVKLQTGFDSTLISPLKIPTHLREKNLNDESSDIGWRQILKEMI